MLDQIEPSVTADSATERIRRMRRQPDFTAFIDRDVRVVGLETAEPAADGTPTYSSIAVLVADRDIDATRVELAFWDSALASTEWRLVAQAMRQASSLDQVFASVLGPGPHRILDPSCGIGTQVLGLAARGHRVTASDVSAAAIERAREEAALRGLEITFAVADMREARSTHGGEFDVVLSADNSVPHLPDDAAAEEAFTSFLSALRPGGLVAISVRDHSLGGRTGFDFAPYGVRKVEGGRVTVFQIREHRGEEYDLSMYFVEERGDGWPKVTVGRSRYRAIPSERWLTLLAAAGFVETRRLDGAFFQPLLLGRKPVGRGP